VTHNNPQVSIIIPTYNSAGYLQQAIQSVISQTFTDWELLIIDNNSTDNTKEVVNEFADQRIFLYFIQNQGVIAASRNLGLRHSRAKWVSFLDADDLWSRNKIQSCFDMAEQGFDVVYHPMKILRDKASFFSRRTTNSWQVESPVLGDLLAKGNPIANSSVFLKMELLIDVGNINENKSLIAAEDYNTWLEISEKTEKFYFLNSSLGTYRIHDSNTSSSVDRTISHEKVISRYFGRLDDIYKKKALAYLAYIRGKVLLLNRDYLKATQEFEKALRSLDRSLVIQCRYYLYKSRLFRFFSSFKKQSTSG
jgi:glycosyltransferase involved in cell wall biosynthesis